MELKDLFANVELIKWLATAAATVGLAGLIVLLGEFGIAAPVARIYHRFQGEVEIAVSEVVELTDEPTDSANIKLAEVTRIPAEVWATFLPVFFNALATGLGAALTQVPAVEVNIAAPAEAASLPTRGPSPTYEAKS